MKNFLTSAGSLHRCEQCGRCSSACPITGENDFNIRQIIRYVEASQVSQLIENLLPCLCLACGRCEEACPNDVSILEVIRTIRGYIPNEFIPAVPCVEACPAKIDIPGFIRMIAKGKEYEALELILEKVPIPGILGRVCGRPCESKCKRSYIDSPVSICNLKRHVSGFGETDHIFEKAYKPGEDTKKRILIIGSGPAGLTAAYYLRKKGHYVTIMEKREEVGGMLRYGIPDYRLPKSVLTTEIDRIINMGIDLKTGVSLVDLMNHQTLKSDFDAFFIAIGLQSSQVFPTNITLTRGITYGLDFLVDTNSGKLENVGKDIIVVGGGNVAIDAARSAVRLGARSVTLVCLESREEMLADPLEIEMAFDEGVKIINSWGINKFLGNKTLIGIELINCESVLDKEGNFSPKFGTNIITLDVDQAIISIGQTTDKKSVEDLLSILDNSLITKGELLTVDSKSRVLGSKNIFAGGDAIGEPGSVVGAVASGYSAAASIDYFLGGSGLFSSNDQPFDSSDLRKAVANKQSSYSKRQKAGELSKDKRVEGFSEVDSGLTENQASIEATRCLCCDLEYHLACSS